jgi:hypothetical protein
MSPERVEDAPASVEVNVLGAGTPTRCALEVQVEEGDRFLALSCVTDGI